MLGDEHRMPFEGGLFAVVSRIRCGQPFRYQFGRIGENGMQALPLNVSQFLRAQLEAPTEGRTCEIVEKLIDVLRGGPPLEQRHGRRPNHDLVLPEFLLQLTSVPAPP
jgi:hypothetical protein